MYKEFKNLNLPTIDQEMLAFWEQNKIFEKSVEQRPLDNTFVFYEGPPSANGKPGIHHVMARAIKDLVCRYHTLNGKRVERKGGWDTHGLPIELSVEKELGITKEDIGDKISVDEYNHKCRETVMRYKDLWDDLTRKMGYWVDLDNPYITYKNEYIESVWWLLKQLYDKGLLYKGYTIQPYSPGAGTGLSSHELNMPGAYKEVSDTTAVALFKVLRNPSSERLFETPDEDVRIAAWTTTPWTLPSNTALTAGPKVDYVKIKTLNPYTNEPMSVVLAEALVGKWFAPKESQGSGKNQPEVIEKSTAMKGTDLEGIRYEQLLDFGNEIEPLLGNDGEYHTDAFRVVLGDFVTTEDGTGIVHTAPSFGADDMKAAKASGIGALTLVDKQGKFLPTVGEFSNRYVKNYKDEEDYRPVDIDIVIKLKTENKALNVAKYVHNYPHCWRTDKPVLYYPLDSWFVKASACKERMYELNKTINWKPASTGEGRFGKWLENLQDWNLSRSRYWGIPLPIWRTAPDSNRDSQEKCIGTVADLRSEIEKANKALGLNQEAPKDLHRPYIDDVVLVSDDGQEMKRELDLIDVWFDSGSMPYAQWHYPMENQDVFERNFPADFIAEGVDQTRGWFYTLHAIATMVFDSVAFRNVVSNGLVLDKNGNKMSKRLNNAADPFETIEKYGADATRWYMISNSQPWDNLKFDLEGIGETQRKFFGTLYNTYSFFALYANIDKWTMDEMDVLPMADRSELDRWVISKLYSLVDEFRIAMDDYEPTRACRAIEDFVDNHLSNWFVRLSRRRFWKGEMSTDKRAAYETLFECLMVTGQLSTCVAPFFADWLYKNLTDPIREKAIANNTPLRHESVHLTDLVERDANKVDKALEQRMDYAQRISSLILSLRKKENIRVRQPLQKVMLPILDEGFIKHVEGVKDLIMAETNIKEIEYITDTAGVIKKKIKPNFKTLGKRLGKNMKAAADVVASFSQNDISNLEKTGNYVLNVDGEKYDLTLEDFEITAEDVPGLLVATDGPLTVALDVTLNDDLIAEGTARELVNRIQNIRKGSDFNVTDKINIQLEKHDAILAAVENYGDYIKQETLALSLDLANDVDGEEVELLDGIVIKIRVDLAIGGNGENKKDFIQKLLLDLESDRVERTVSTNNTDKFSQAICAFSNDYPNHRLPGYLLIGAKDDGTLDGLKITDELLINLAAIRHNGQILPQPALSVQKFSLPGGDVAMVEVTPSFHPPVRYKGKVWIRTGPTKAVANETEERRLIEKRTATAKTFDALPCVGANLKDLSIDLFKLKYLPVAVDKDTLIANNRNLKEQLASLKMYDLLHDCPTNAGMLTLSLNPLYYLPGAYIQYVKFKGENMLDQAPLEKTFSGSLIDTLPALEDFLRYSIIENRTARGEGLRDVLTKSFPFAALRELLMNAILHRDYESNAPIYLYEFSDRIEIHNPGGLYGDARPSNFPHVSDYRNPVLAEILKNLGYINKFNFGIINAKEELRRNGNPQPIFDLSLETKFLVKIFQ